MKELFLSKRFTPEAEGIVLTCNRIIERYQAEGYDLSLRQLYYQLIAGNLFPEDRSWKEVARKWVRTDASDPDGTRNAEPNYKWLGDIVTDARLAGLMDWAAIKDRGRVTEFLAHWESPSQILRACAKQFRIDLWDTQPCHVEVMVEKQALEGVLLPVCEEMDVRFTANKGYSSSSALYETGQRLKAARRDGKRPVVIYLGDHDPSGIDMTRDVEDRLRMFSRGAVEVVRAALNMDQVEELNPPENPAKMTDSRAAAYVEQFGESSWELDAIEPRALAELVRKAIGEQRDPDEFQAAEARQEEMRLDLTRMADEYEERHEDETGGEE